MKIKYCPNCLSRTPGMPCPLCGYDPAAAPAVPQALEQVILHGRYLTGRALQKTGMDITYRAKDLTDGTMVEIQEYFPAAQAVRSEDGITLTWTGEDTSAAFLSQHPVSGPVLSSFPENGTVYIVRTPGKPRPAPAKSQPPKESELVPFLIALTVIVLLIVLSAVGIQLMRPFFRSYFGVPNPMIIYDIF